MERRRLAGSPWSVQACVVLSLFGVSAGIVFRFHHIKPKTLKKFSKMRKYRMDRNLRVLFQTLSLHFLFEEDLMDERRRTRDDGR